MKTPKPLLNLDKEALINFQIKSLKNSHIEEIIVVLGSNAEEIKKVILSNEVKVVENIDFELGKTTSIKKGLSEINQLRRQHLGFIIIGEKSECKNRGRTVAHELGHMFSLLHKHDQETDLMMWGTGTKIQNWQVNKFIKYHDKYLKKRLAF